MFKEVNEHPFNILIAITDLAKLKKKDTSTHKKNMFKVKNIYSISKEKTLLGLKKMHN